MRGLTITGIPEIDRALAKLDAKLQKKTIKKAVRSALRPLEDEIVRRFPKDSGETAKQIKVRAGNKSRTAINVDVKSKDDNYIAKFLEFGTKNADGSVRIAARPTFRPVFDTMRESASKAAQAEILAEVERANNK
ncbi:MAG: HK97 gp10 family phage protein [Planctomycetaceae bacterium]